MGDVVGTAATEEYQITGFQVFAADLYTVVILLGSSTREAVAEVLIAVQDKAGAVEAVGAVSAVDIGIAQVALGKGKKKADADTSAKNS